MNFEKRLVSKRAFSLNVSLTNSNKRRTLRLGVPACSKEFTTMGIIVIVCIYKTVEQAT